MIVKEEFLSKLRRYFSLNLYEVKIWTALLSRGVSTAVELSDIANVPRSRSYDVLESLEKKGFVVMKLGKPIKYLAIPPKGVLENIKKQIEKKTETRLSQIKNTTFNNLINTFQEVHEKNTNQDENIVAVLRGRKNIHKHLAFLFKDAKKEILFPAEDKTSAYVKTNIDTKNKTKITLKTPNTGIRMSLVDDTNTIIFPLQEDEVHPEYDLCIWIRNTHTTKFLKNLLTSV